MPLSIILIVNFKTLRLTRWLYSFTVSSLPRVAHTHVPNSRAQQQIWLLHHCLGHPSFSYVRLLFPYLFQGLVDSQFQCETWVLAKSHRTIFPLSDDKTEFPFELVHFDVWGSAKISPTSKRWFVTFIDDYARMTWVYFLAHKSDVTTTICEFHAMITTKFHASIKVFRSDNGGDMWMVSWLNSFGTKPSFIKTPPLSLPNKMVLSNKRIANYLRLHMPTCLINRSLTTYGVMLAKWSVVLTPTTNRFEVESTST